MGPVTGTTVSRTFTEEARRAQILACTIDALSEFGYSGTSFARVAERAGFSKSVISYYFGTKDELLRQVVADVVSDAAAYMTPRIAAAGESAPAVLSTYVRSNLEYIRDHPDGIAAVTEIAIGMRADHRNPRLADGPGGRAHGLKPLEEILARGQRSGDFTEFDVRGMAWAIRGLIDGVNPRRLVDPEFDFDRCIDELDAHIARATRGVLR